MRVPSRARKTFRRIKEYPVPNFGDQSIRPRRPKDGMSLAKMAKEKLETGAKEWLQDKSIGEILTECQKMAEGCKNPVGATGINLHRPGNRKVAVHGAGGEFTNSTSLYAYRKPRKRPADVVQYAMKTMATDNSTSLAGAQVYFDINILDMEPVKDNPDSNDKYSNCTIRHAFDRYLKDTMKATTNDGAVSLDAVIQQSSIHVKSLTIDLVFTNKASTMCFLDVYELVPQHNLGPTEYITGNSKKATGYMSPSWTFENGLAGDVLELQDDLQAVDIQANPFNSTTFSRTWKVVKQVRVNLRGNSVHRHKSAYSINKTVSYQEMAQFSTAGGKHAGWNPTFLVVQKGAPGTSQGADGSEITYAANIQLNYEANPSRQAKVIVFDDKT